MTPGEQVNKQPNNPVAAKILDFICAVIHSRDDTKYFSLRWISTWFVAFPQYQSSNMYPTEMIPELTLRHRTSSDDELSMHPHIHPNFVW
jgi:hypothetical protein